MWFWNEAWSTVLIATWMPVAVVHASMTDWSACFGAGSEALEPSVTRPPNEGPGDWVRDRHAASRPPTAASAAAPAAPRRIARRGMGVRAEAPEAPSEADSVLVVSRRPTAAGG